MTATADVSNATANRRRKHSTGRILLEFLGSMNLAITLLVVVAIASVIGSVIQQDQSWNAYLSKFGPFWFEVFRLLGLYDVYSAPWFMGMLAFLLLSTSVCVYRHAPGIFKEITRFRERQGDASLRAHRNHRELHCALAPEQAAAEAAKVVRHHGFRLRSQREQAGRLVLAGMRGRSNRLGYLFTHIAVVIICVGGLIDANPRLLLMGWTGQLQIETRNDVPLSDLHEDSRLPPGASTSFRGNISIPEGQAGRAVYLDVRDGYVAQELPFTIEVEAFRISYWDNGQPRSYESDLVIHDPEREEPLRETIAVNHPLQYRGHTIYQASYSDGGTEMDLVFWPINNSAEGPVSGSTAVHGDLPVSIGERRYTLEMLEFEKYNMRPDHEGEQARASIDAGPSFTYRLRKATGEAREYHNFKRPMPVDGRYYFLTGMRTSQAESYRYLYIPADPDRSLGRFTRLLGELQQPERRRAAATAAVERLFDQDDTLRSSLMPYLTSSAAGLVTHLLDGGLPAVERAISDLVRAGGLEGQAAELVAGLLQDAFHATLAEAYANALVDEGYDRQEIRAGLSESDNRFFSDAMDVLMVLPAYGAPVFPELREFRHRQATGLQITRAPGQSTVYFGSLLLTVGLFLLFYVRPRRFWVRLQPDNNGGTQVLMAGMDQRRSREFGGEFERLHQALTRRLQAREHA